jgi:hypothetical protein
MIFTVLESAWTNIVWYRKSQFNGLIQNFRFGSNISLVFFYVFFFTGNTALSAFPQNLLI